MGTPGRAWKHLTVEELRKRNARMIALRKKGKSVHQIVQLLHSNRDIVYRVLRMNGCGFSNDYVPDGMTRAERDHWIVQMRDEGLSSVEIGKKTRLTAATISRTAKEMGKPFTPGYKISQTNSRAKNRVRDWEIFQARQQGMTYREIRERWGMDEGQACRTVKREIREREERELRRAQAAKRVHEASLYETNGWRFIIEGNSL